MKKLFIYIPTYNRPVALEKQLSVILPQVADLPEQVRILVNDNASDSPLTGYKKKHSVHSNIQFQSNVGNIGGNANIALGFVFSQPDEFLWILSDNDIVTDTAVEYLLQMLDDKIDFYCFVDTVKEAVEIDHSWEGGWQTPMDWRLGLISDALYNINTVKSSIDEAFYFHNSSFPHLAVACAAAKKKGVVKFMLLPRIKINNDLYSSDEAPTDYSLAHVAMPLLVALFPAWEAKSFSLKWLRKHGITMYRDRRRHYHLYLQSRATLAYYGGWSARLLLNWMWGVALIANPLIAVRQKIIGIAKRRFSASTIKKLENIRRVVWGE
jgi:glycosyltransferase involved in cell wall biosynthesis